ncbi:LysR substrate-binding domain-containing protein [Pseudochelatococcus sp. B33]
MPLVNLDMHVLRSFVAGVNLGSSARAAENVGRSQSAISLQLRKLETQCGKALFRREGRKLVLTDEGETLYRYAVRLLELNDEAIGVINQGNIEGYLRVGMPPDVAETWLPGLLGRFSRHRPNVTVEARVDRNATLLEDLSTGALDVALFWRDTTPSMTHPPYQVVANLPIVWVGPDDKAALSSLFDNPIPLVLMGAPCMFRSKGTAALEKQGQNWRLSFTSQSLASLWAAVRAGLGITIRTSEGVPPGMRILDPEQYSLPPLGETNLCLQASSVTSPLVEQFIVSLKEQVLPLPVKTKLPKETA